MATLKRRHAPMVWGAQVDILVWKRSQAGKQRRRRDNKPPLAHDHGWDWDGSRVVLNEGTATSYWEDGDSDGQEESREENVPLSQRQLENISPFDVAGYPIAKRRGKARATLGDFEVVRVPKVVPLLEGLEFEDDWEQLDEWEKVEVASFKRTYSEVVRSATDSELEGKDPPR